MDRGKKSSRGLSPQSPSRSRPANISTEQSRGQAGSRQGPGRVQAGSRPGPGRVQAGECFSSHNYQSHLFNFPKMETELLRESRPAASHRTCKQCLYFYRPDSVYIHTGLSIFSPFLPAQCQDCQEGRAPGWVVVVVCLKVAVPG